MKYSIFCRSIVFILEVMKKLLDGGAAMKYVHTIKIRTKYLVWEHEEEKNEKYL